MLLNDISCSFAEYLFKDSFGIGASNDVLLSGEAGVAPGENSLTGEEIAENFLRLHYLVVDKVYILGNGFAVAPVLMSHGVRVNLPTSGSKYLAPACDYAAVVGVVLCVACGVGIHKLA